MRLPFHGSLIPCLCAKLEFILLTPYLAPRTCEGGGRAKAKPGGAKIDNSPSHDYRRASPLLKAGAKIRNGTINNHLVRRYSRRVYSLLKF